MTYETKNNKIEKLTEKNNKLVKELADLQKKYERDVRSKNEVQELTIAAFDRENTYKRQSAEVERYKAMRFNCLDVADLSADLTLNDMDYLLGVFRDRISVMDYASPFPINTDQNEAFSYVDHGHLEVFQTVLPAPSSIGFLEGSTFRKWLEYMPNNLLHTFDSKAIEENTKEVKMTFTMRK